MNDLEMNELETQKEQKKLIALEVPEEMYQLIRKEAYENCTSISAMIRSMIKYYLNIENK